MLSENCYQKCGICQLTGIMNNSHNKLNVGYYILVHYSFTEISFSVTGKKKSLRTLNGLYHILVTFVKNKLQIPSLAITRKKLRTLLIS